MAPKSPKAKGPPELLRATIATAMLGLDKKLPKDLTSSQVEMANEPTSEEATSETQTSEPTTSDASTSEQTESVEASEENVTTSEDQSGKDGQSDISAGKETESEATDSSPSRSKKKRGKVQCSECCCKKVDATSTEEASADESTRAITSSDTRSEAVSENCDKHKGKSAKKQKKAKNKNKGADTTSASENIESSAQTGNETSDAEAKPETSSKAATSDTDAQKGNVDDDSGWTMSEDCLLRALKEGGETWAHISGALNRSKKDVRARWNIIKDRPTETDADNEDFASTTQNTGGESSAAEQESEKSTDDKTKGKPKHEKKPSVEENSEYKGKDTVPVDDKWHKGIRNAKVASENKKAKAKKAVTDILSGEEASSETSSSPSTWAPIHDLEGEKGSQDRYLRYIQRQIYPPTISPKPDATFSKTDCEVLALVESKYTRGKWLEMQANFFNVTGRMVPLEIIRRKCETAEKPKQVKQDKKRRSDVQKWVEAVDEGDLEDPET